MVNEEELKALFRNHLDHPDNNEFIDLEVDGEVIYQYAQGLHNITLLDDSEFSELRSFLKERDNLDRTQFNEKEGWMTCMGDYDLESDFETMKQILRKRGLSIEDIDDARDNVGAEQIGIGEV